jgi:hypothetical protein
MRRIPAVRLRRNRGYGAEQHGHGQGAQKRFHDVTLSLPNFALITPRGRCVFPKIRCAPMPLFGHELGSRRPPRHILTPPMPSHFALPPAAVRIRDGVLLSVG